MKLILKIIAGLLLLLIVGGVGGYFYMKNRLKPTPNYLSIKSTNASTPFTWWTLRQAPEVYDYSAMMIPIIFPGVQDTFLMQFDTGSPRCRFRSQSIASIQEKYQNLDIRAVEGGDRLYNLNFKVGDIEVYAEEAELYVRKGGQGIDWTDSLHYPLIGTIGSDFIDNQITIIDYPNQTLKLMAEMPKEMERQLSFSPISFANRRVLIEGQLNEEDTGMLMWDSGSSMFEFITSKNHWEKLAAPDAQAEKMAVNSWGNTLYAYNVASKSGVTIGSNTFPVNTITYIDKMAFFQSFLTQLTGLSGLTGNKIFINDVILLDTKENRFAKL